MIEITCPREGFRRGGIAHPKGTTTYKDDDISLKQLAEIEEEPLLHVIRIDEDMGGSGVDGVSGLTKQERLIMAVEKLDPENEDHFTKDKKPRPGALADLVGENVTGAERDKAWIMFQKRQELNK